MIRSSLQFLEVPLKGKKERFFGIFFSTFFDTFGLIGSIKTIRPIYDLHFVYIDILSFILKGGFGGLKKIITSFWQFLAILAIKMAVFFKARTLFKTIFEN